MINAMIEIKPDGSIHGKYREQMTDYTAFAYRERYSNLSNEANMERIEKAYNSLEVSEIIVKNIKDAYEPIIEEVTFVKTNAVDVIGDKIYFSPLFIFGLKSNPFTSDKREFPIDFVYPNQDKFMFSINIPEGYEIESLPESIMLEFEQNYLGYKYQIKQFNNAIQLSFSFDINSSIISSEYYPLLKDFFTRIVEKNKEQIVLKRI
jgi:hypothetical protein